VAESRNESDNIVASFRSSFNVHGAESHDTAEIFPEEIAAADESTK
jgi:hypothetical protein